MNTKLKINRKITGLPKVSSRYSINGAEFRPIDKTEGFLTVTDGRWLGISKVEHNATDEIETVLIPGELLPSRKTGGVVTINGDIRCEQSKAKIGEPLEGNFPPCGDILPELTGDYRRITFDVNFLAHIASMISDTDAKAVVTLFIGKENRPIAVLGSHNAIGVLMPVNPTNTDEQTDRNAYNALRNEYKEAVSN